MYFKISLIALGAACSVVLLQAPSALAAPADDEKKSDETIIVTVQAGDTLTSIAERYDLTYPRVFDANSQIADPDMIDIGQKIRIPKSDEKLPNRLITSDTQSANYTTSSAQAFYPSTFASPAPSPVTYRATTAGNTYGWGQCTWYVKSRRADIPNMLGNGGSWVSNAAARGFATGNIPRAGAVAEIPGHVMYVESVNANGTINISEMNFNGGVGVVSKRTIPASSARYIY